MEALVVDALGHHFGRVRRGGYGLRDAPGRLAPGSAELGQGRASLWRHDLGQRVGSLARRQAEIVEARPERPRRKPTMKRKPSVKLLTWCIWRALYPGRGF